MTTTAKPPRGRFRKVDVRIWNDSAFMAFSDDAKLVFLFLLTHPNLTSLGAMRATRAGLAEELGWPLPKFSRALAAITRAGAAEHDPAAAFLWLPNFLRYNSPENRNVVIGWAKALDLLPECALRGRLLEHARRHCEASETPGVAGGFREAFGTRTPPDGETVAPTVSEPLPEPSGNGMPNQEQLAVAGAFLTPTDPTFDEDQAPGPRHEREGGESASRGTNHRATAWLQHYGEAHRATRNSRYLLNVGRDLPHALRLVEAYTDDELHALTRIYLDATGPGFDDKPRTPGTLAHQAPRLEERLRQVGHWPGSAPGASARAAALEEQRRLAADIEASRAAAKAETEARGGTPLGARKLSAGAGRPGSVRSRDEACA